MASKGKHRTEHESFIWPKKKVEGRWDKVKAIGADYDSSFDEEEIEDDEFRLRGGISMAVREASREDPFSSSFLDEELILLEEARELGIPEDEAEEFIDDRRNP